MSTMLDHHITEEYKSVSAQAEPLLEVKELKKWFPIQKGFSEAHDRLRQGRR